VAIRTDGRGDVTATHLAFSLRRGVPHNPSPLLAAGKLYMVSDMGVLTCVDAARGDEIWRERLSGNFSASPTLADGKIYVVGEDATTYVLAPGEQFQLLAANHLEGRALASPAFVDGAIFLRTDIHLYRVEQLGNQADVAKPMTRRTSGPRSR
jgi:outer membrane protein assembly factor BamB